MEILRKADLEAMTEFKVRVTASERLGMDLTRIEHKTFVRSVIESFLLSNHVDDQTVGKEARLGIREETKEVVQEGQGTKPNPVVNEDHEQKVSKLSNNRSVEALETSGNTFVSVRKFCPKGAKKIPSAKGIPLANEEQPSFKNSDPPIQDMKMTSKLRSEHGGSQIEDLSNCVADFNPEVIPFENYRFDGKNYLCWAQHMEYFLKQLQIAYVLTDPCPSTTLTPEASSAEVAQAKAAQQKWVNDDYICQRELWEELRYVYLNEEYGTKRSQVKKYIEFQMDDKKPILEQIHELNMIVDSIIAAGMVIDDNFHVSVIMFKLPPSWKDFCIKLLREEYLPFSMLMDCLMLEVELRNQNRNSEPSNVRAFHQAKVYGPSKGDMKKPSLYSKKRSSDKDNNNAIVCYNCGKKGHVSRHCHSRKLDKDVTGKRVEGTTATAAVPVFNIVDGVVE